MTTKSDRHRIKPFLAIVVRLLSRTQWCVFFLREKKCCHWKFDGYLSRASEHFSVLHFIFALLRDVFVCDLFDVRRMAWHSRSQNTSDARESAYNVKGTNMRKIISSNLYQWRIDASPIISRYDFFDEI